MTRGEPDTLDAGDLDYARADGLVPAVAQDALTGEVLMLAYANDGAVEAAASTGAMHYWSRSRDELWRKGETSDHTQDVASLHADCDADALLARVHQTGPACHTGEPTCFYTPLVGDAVAPAAPKPTLAALDDVLAQRDAERPEGSWTTQLLEDEEERLGKVTEEAQEVVEAARAGDADHLAEEIADLVYHALVAGRAEGVGVRDVLRVLDERRD